MKPQIVRAGVYALVALGLLLGVHEAELLLWPAAAPGIQPAFLSNAAAPDVSFVVGSSHDCANHGLLVNEGVYPNATKTAYIPPELTGGWNAATIKGHTVTLRGVPLSSYRNAKTGKDSPEYKVTQSSQISVQ
jgi:hypothetical protein